MENKSEVPRAVKLKEVIHPEEWGWELFKVAEVKGGTVTPIGETWKILQRVKIIVQGRTCPPGSGYHLQS